MTESFWDCIKRIVDDQNLSSNEKLVAIVLRCHQNKNGWAWPSPLRISRKSALGRSTVYRALAGLETKVRIEKREADRGPQYHLVEPGRAEQQLGLWESCEDREQILCPPCGNASHTETKSSHSGTRSKYIEEKPKPGPSRTYPVRGFSSGLGKLDAKARRILGEIETAKHLCVGLGPSDGETATRVHQRLDALYAELERIGCRVEKAG